MPGRDAVLTDTAADAASADARLGQLDALRAFAILAVLFEHWSGLREWVPIGAGTLGVGLFFTLSGFLITGILLEDLSKHGATTGSVLRGFYVRRAARLVPAFYAWLLILALLGVGGIASSWPWHVTYLSNFYMAAGGTESVLWSLAVEEQFYLLWPLVLIVTPRRWLVPAAIVMIALAAASKVTALALGHWLSFYLLPWQLDVLGAGCLIAILSFRDGRRNRFQWFTAPRRTIFGAAAILCLGVAALDWYVYRGGPTRYLVMNTLCAVFFAWLVMMTAREWRGPIGRVFDSHALQYLGRISYGVYLVHNFMPDIVERVLGPMPKYQAAPIVVVLTFGLCALSWRFFEQPIIRMGRRLSRDIEAERSGGRFASVTPEPTRPA